MIPFIGGSAAIRVSEAETRRLINMMPSPVESDSAKSPIVGAQVPGLVEVADLGAECRGMLLAQDRFFAVGGNKLKEVATDYSVIERGTLASVSGLVSMDKNRYQAVIVDGLYGYAYDFVENEFTQIVNDAFYGSNLVTVNKGTAVFNRPGTDVFYTSAIDDVLTLDATSFASAESSPDKIVGHISDHEQLFIFGTDGTEVHDNTGGTDFVFVKNSSASIQVGCASGFTIAQLDNTLFWLGAGKSGDGVVWKLSGYTPVRVSTAAIEQLLQAPGIDLSQASAFAVQDEGHSLYFLNVPGLETTWVYDAKSNLWHEWAEFVDGEFTPFRARCHLFAWGRHFLGDASGKIYALDHDANTFAGSVKCRDIISPHRAAPNNQRFEINKFELDCDVGHGLPSGQAGQVMIRYSKNKGKTWSNWRYANAGVVGDYRAIPKIHKLGMGKDWVFHVRCTEDMPFNVLGANAA